MNCLLTSVRILLYHRPASLGTLIDLGFETKLYFLDLEILLSSLSIIRSLQTNSKTLALTSPRKLTVELGQWPSSTLTVMTGSPSKRSRY